MKSPSFSFVSASKRFTSKFYLWNTNLTIMRFVVLQSEEVYSQTVSDSFVANMYFQIDCDLDLVLGRYGKMTTTLYRTGKSTGVWKICSPQRGLLSRGRSKSSLRKDFPVPLQSGVWLLFSYHFSISVRKQNFSIKKLLQNVFWLENGSYDSKAKLPEKCSWSLDSQSASNVKKYSI